MEGILLTRTRLSISKLVDYVHEQPQLSSVCWLFGAVLRLSNGMGAITSVNAFLLLVANTSVHWRSVGGLVSVAKFCLPSTHIQSHVITKYLPDNLSGGLA